MAAPFTAMSRGILGRAIVLDDHGVRCGRRRVAWDEVDYYGYEWRDWTRPGDFVLVSRGGQVLRVAPVASHWTATAERVIAALHPRLRADPRFGPFTLEDDALSHVAHGRLPFDAIAHVELEALGPEVIAVVHARDAGAWAQAEVVQIDSFWLWLERLAEHDVAIVSPLSLHLPPALRALDEHVARDARLPRAIIHRR